jgi:iron-sulfur cluster insertion protein
MITLTDSAKSKIKELILEEGNPDIKLRVFVQGGGCSGMQYGFTFDEMATEDDFVLAEDGVEILVDSASGMYLQGATINYRDDLMGSSFVIDNPNAQTTCGCGSSFGI